MLHSLHRSRRRRRSRLPYRAHFYIFSFKKKIFFSAQTNKKTQNKLKKYNILSRTLLNMYKIEFIMSYLEREREEEK